MARRGVGLGFANVIAYDPYASEVKAAALGVKLVSFEEALAQGDFFSLHMPMTPQTKVCASPALHLAATVSFYAPTSILKIASELFWAGVQHQQALEPSVEGLFHMKIFQKHLRPPCKWGSAFGCLASVGLEIRFPVPEQHSCSMQGMFNDSAFGKMKKGARIINVARGGVIDEAALARALDSGVVAQVGDSSIQEPCSCLCRRMAGCTFQ